MCVIVDANMASKFFDRDPEMLPLWNWIGNRKAVLVVGGKLLDELYQVNLAADQIQAWLKAGLAHLEPSENIDAEEPRIRGRCQSDDPHVIALALASDARLLCSSDQDLHADFRNPALISNPRGAIYQNASHRHLLRHAGRCPHKPRD